MLNPHDDVSLRRVINVPARGIGKGVMDSLEAVELAMPKTRLPPLLAGSAAGASEQIALGEAGPRGRAQRLLAPRASASLTAFRDLLVRADGDGGARSRCRIALGKVLDQSGYLQDLREERSEEAEGRIENLLELVSAAREYEITHAGAVARLASSISCRCCRTSTRKPGPRTPGC